MPSRKPHKRKHGTIQWHRHNISSKQPDASGETDGNNIVWHNATNKTNSSNTSKNMSTAGKNMSTKTGKTMVESSRDHRATNKDVGPKTTKKMSPNTSKNMSTNPDKNMSTKTGKTMADDTRGSANIGKGTQTKVRKLLQCDEPPILTSENILGIVQSFDASYHRRSRIEMLQSMLNISVWDAKLMYAGIHRRCSTIYGPPKGTEPSERTALIVSGQTRSLLDENMLEYWQKVTKAIRRSGRKLTVFGVFDEISKSIDMQNRSVQHNDSIDRIEGVIRHWARKYKLVFLHGDSSMIGHAKLVKNPKLREILTPHDAAEKDRIGEGFECGSMKLVIGLDLMLEYEQENNISFAHVLRSRPDYVYLNWFNPVYFRVVWDTLDDAVYMMNDVMAMMPRRNAGAYLTYFQMHRGLKNSSQLNEVVLLDDMVRNNKDGSPLQPTTMMAIHGILFAGHGLELDTWLPGRGQDGVPYAGLESGCHDGDIVREDAEKGACLPHPNPILNRFIGLPFCE